MGTVKKVPPPNWLRLQCPACGLWVTGLVNDAKPVADHPCGKTPAAVAEAVARIESGEFDLDDDDDDEDPRR